MALNSFDRRFEPEQCDVRIHDLGRVFERSFMARFEPLNQGVKVTLDAKAQRLADVAAKQRIANAARNRRKLKYGFKEDGHVIGCYGELAVVALTGVEDWTTVPDDLGNGKCKAADVGRILQVRATSNVESWIPIYPDDNADAPFIGVTANPPSLVCVVHGWVYGWEAKLRPLKDLHLGRTSFHPSYPHQHHDLCDLPEDNFAWLRSLPTGYLKQIQEQEQYEKEHAGEFKF